MSYRVLLHDAAKIECDSPAEVVALLDEIIVTVGREKRARVAREARIAAPEPAPVPAPVQVAAPKRTSGKTKKEPGKPYHGQCVICGAAYTAPSSWVKRCPAHRLKPGQKGGSKKRGLDEDTPIGSNTMRRAS